MNSFSRFVLPGILLGVLILTIPGDKKLEAAAVGTELANVTLTNVDGKPSTIPYFGTRVISIFYNDANTSDIGDPLADAIKAKNYSKDKYVGIGIANAKDSRGIPDFAIRLVLKGKVKRYKSTMLMDKEHKLKTAWGLGNCDDTCVVLIIGKDRKLKYATRFTSQAGARAKIPEVIDLLDRIAR